MRMGDLIEIPVTVPDDEILIDRLGITSTQQLAEEFNAMIQSTEDSGGHLVFQLHPERFHIFGQALDNALKLAISKGAWIATLKDVAQWWTRRSDEESRWPDEYSFAITISGDIDAMTIGDFFMRRLGR